MSAEWHLARWRLKACGLSRHMQRSPLIVITQLVSRTLHWATPNSLGPQAEWATLAPSTLRWAFPRFILGDLARGRGFDRRVVLSQGTKLAIITFRTYRACGGRLQQTHFVAYRRLTPARCALAHAPCMLAGYIPLRTTLVYVSGGGVSYVHSHVRTSMCCNFRCMFVQHWLVAIALAGMLQFPYQSSSGSHFPPSRLRGWAILLPSRSRAV